VQDTITIATESANYAKFRPDAESNPWHNQAGGRLITSSNGRSSPPLACADNASAKAPLMISRKDENLILEMVPPMFFACIHEFSGKLLLPRKLCLN